MSSPILAFKAGRAHRRGETNWVDPDNRKGAISLVNGDDGLLHFIWTDRANGQVEEDLILFPSDASFVKVSQASSGRIYALKFTSSNQIHFFWMQDANSARDEEFANNLNGVLQDSDFTPVWNVTPTPAQPQASANSSAPAAQEHLVLLQEMLTSVANSTAPPDLSLADLLTPATLAPLFTEHPELIHTLFPHLPTDLPVPPSAEALQRIISSPQFRSAVAHFDQALRTGMLSGMVRGLGLPESAGVGVVAFLRAIQEQADRERSSTPGAAGGQNEDTMDTD